MLIIITVDPFKAHLITVIIVECIILLIQCIQFLYEFLQTLMSRLIQYIPVKASCLTPFPFLSELLSHEQQFFARMRIHKPISGL